MNVAYCIIPRIGGTYRFYLNLRKALNNTDCNIYGVSIGPEIRLWDENYADGNCVKIAPSEKNFQLCAREFIDWIKETKIDIVIPMDSSYALSSIPFLHSNTKVVMCCSTITKSSYDAVTVYLDRTSKIIVNSKRQLDDLQKIKKIDKKKLILIPHGTDLHKKHESPPLICRNNNYLNIIYSGRIKEDSKGIFLFPKTLDFLEKWNVPFHLKIIGSGPDERILRYKLKKWEQIGKVTFCGNVPPSQVPFEISNADIFLMPSRFEGFGISLIECMAQGVVPIVSKIRGVTDWIVDNEVNGLVCKQRSAKYFAKNISRLHNDRTLLERFKESAIIKTTMEFSLKQMRINYYRLFREVFDEKDFVIKQIPWSNFKPIIIQQPSLLPFIPSLFKRCIPTAVKIKIKYFFKL